MNAVYRERGENSTLRFGLSIFFFASYALPRNRCGSNSRADNLGFKTVEYSKSAVSGNARVFLRISQEFLKFFRGGCTERQEASAGGGWSALEGLSGAGKEGPGLGSKKQVQAWKKWSTGLPPCALYWAGIGVCKKQVQGGWSTGREGMEVGRHWRLQETRADLEGDGAQDYRPVLSTGQALASARNKCRPGRMEHRPYRPVLATGQAGMPTLPKACRSLAVVT